MTANLAAITGRAPRAIALRRDGAGRPFLDPPGPDVSISHSGPLLAVAACQGARVGVDVEQLRPRARLLRIADRAFPPGVAAHVRAAPGEAEQLARFYGFWTAYEALAKALGTGLRLPARDLAVSPPAPDGAFALTHPAAGDGPWEGRHLPLDGAIACVVAAGPTPVSVRRAVARG